VVAVNSIDIAPSTVCPPSSQSLPDSLENTFVKGQVIQRHTRTHRGAGDGSKGRETSMFVWLVLAVYDLKFSVEIVFFFSPKTVSRTSLLTGQRLLIVAVNRQNQSQKQDGYGAKSSYDGPAGRGRGPREGHGRRKDGKRSVGQDGLRWVS